MMKTVLELAGLASTIALACCFLIFPILAIFRRTRRAAGYGYVTCSYVFGGGLWIVCVLTVWDAWGSLAVTLGVFLFGVGVLPMALIILGWASQWYLFAEAIVIAAVAMGIRLLGFWLLEKP